MRTNKNEIIRFTITGFITTMVDFIFTFLTSFILQKMGLASSSVWCIIIATTIGFIANVTVGYPLSRNWVYQDYDKERMKSKTTKHLLLFTLLSAIGLLIGIGVMSIFKVTLLNNLNINIDTWMNVVIPEGLGFFYKIGYWISYVLTHATFYWFTLAFIVKTLITLFYNFYTRKRFLFNNN